MSVNGTHSPFGNPNAQRQGQDALGTELSPGGRDRQGNNRHGDGARQGDRFGQALSRAMAATRRAEIDDRPEATPAAVPLSPLQPLAPVIAEATPATRMDTTGIAERIERYLRGAEGAASLRQGEGMVVKLPGNALGVTQVALRLEGEVLVVSVSMQAQAGAAQMSVLGQAIQSRTRHTVRLEAEGEDRPSEDAPFNPLIPRGRQG
jgi:hypothetical protein